jgi:hypothetical protein
MPDYTARIVTSPPPAPPAVTREEFGKAAPLLSSDLEAAKSKCYNYAFKAY